MSADQVASHGVRPPGDLNPRREPALDFPDRPMGELTPADYDVLGFMSGLEIHQQLLTRSKLFCRCPAGQRVTRHDGEVLRHMRPTLSELGEYDGTALMEFKTRKEIVYLLERGSVCTYEMDDTPPFGIDDEAVRVAIEVAQLLNLNLVAELHVMRKQYLDGSIPTGFQRTAMVGLTGSIPFRVPELGVRRELPIRQLSLEEDSCREVSDVGHRITFRTDRLGTPLTETVTEPDLLTPLEVQAGARLLARVAQSTHRVRRGAGAARQDVNVSVAGGRRIELKGVHHHRRLPLLVHIEAFRQLNLLRIKAELERRGVSPELLGIRDGGRPWLVSPLAVDAGPILGTSRHGPIDAALERGDRVCAVRLPGFGGLLERPTQPGVTFAQEFSERVRVIACPVHRPFLTHSGAADGLDPHQWQRLGEALRTERGDAIVLVWGVDDDAETAVREVLLRARDAVVGVPAETRQALPDGTTGFERILPGPDRMYPDTDTPPLPIADAVVEQIRVRLPETPWAREDRYESLGLAPWAARALAAGPWADLFDRLAPQQGSTARRVAGALALRFPYHARRGRPLPGSERLEPLVRALESGVIRPEATTRILDALVSEPGVTAESIIERHRSRGSESGELARAVADVTGRAATLDKRSLDTVLRWAMGEVMPRFLGRVDPRDVRDRLVAAIRGRAGGVAG